MNSTASGNFRCPTSRCPGVRAATTRDHDWRFLACRRGRACPALPASPSQPQEGDRGIADIGSRAADSISFRSRARAAVGPGARPEQRGAEWCEQWNAAIRRAVRVRGRTGGPPRRRTPGHLAGGSRWSGLSTATPTRECTSPTTPATAGRWTCRSPSGTRRRASIRMRTHCGSTRSRACAPTSGAPQAHPHASRERVAAGRRPASCAGGAHEAGRALGPTPGRGGGPTQRLERPAVTRALRTRGTPDGDRPATGCRWSRSSPAACVPVRAGRPPAGGTPRRAGSACPPPAWPGRR